MALNLASYKQRTSEAVQVFWKSREIALQRQIELGKVDQGERAGVTSGKNMDGFMDLMLEIVRANGLAHADIHQRRAVLSLPGYFRPTKLWDLLITYKGELLVITHNSESRGYTCLICQANHGRCQGSRLLSSWRSYGLAPRVGFTRLS